MTNNYLTALHNIHTRQDVGFRTLITALYRHPKIILIRQQPEFLALCRHVSSFYKLGAVSYELWVMSMSHGHDFFFSKKKRQKKGQRPFPFFLSSFYEKLARSSG